MARLYGALTTVTTAAGTAHISTAAGVATIEIGFVQSITPAFVRAITQTALSQGARSAIINTGPVVANLAIPLGLAAQNGTRVFGGTVTQIQAGFISIFQIFIQRL